ncbi:hypothetical protein I7I51_02664 [Histoplasma capsulatum]|uniref:Uncharacterized protein n=1 Tax=Ajellomyces capsulatus TaxID=5037 RepID=A0A8A1MAC0_AJECA|nr:hypothetical protein I7I51_02664 [Histoplasma capsulatum]
MPSYTTSASQYPPCPGPPPKGPLPPSANPTLPCRLISPIPNSEKEGWDNIQNPENTGQPCTFGRPKVQVNTSSDTSLLLSASQKSQCPGNFGAVLSFGCLSHLTLLRGLELSLSQPWFAHYCIFSTTAAGAPLGPDRSTATPYPDNPPHPLSPQTLLSTCKVSPCRDIPALLRCLLRMSDLHIAYPGTHRFFDSRDLDTDYSSKPKCRRLGAGATVLHLLVGAVPTTPGLWHGRENEGSISIGDTTSPARIVPPISRQFICMLTRMLHQFP